ncbi:hypothetical protein CLV44_10890 [Marinobacterium halophilum]|uniref:Uncharacterized protein n=1 Tax=Marinobacterium halophilum TaxID=267374 RepID=A0A2P8EY16_9GAMM|nr:hypothetical protein [Marinobacterium halophilum]PSL14361.1 hypothetical protein CLV44_10890 [Marinobacterium halophilum]
MLTTLALYPLLPWSMPVVGIVLVSALTALLGARLAHRLPGRGGDAFHHFQSGIKLYVGT